MDITIPIINTTNNVVGLDTIRALHQTVVSLRSALENSQTELSRLRDQIKHRAEYRTAIEKLAIENHLLRRKIIANGDLHLDNGISDNEIACMEEDHPEPGQVNDTACADIPKIELSEIASPTVIEDVDVDNLDNCNLQIERDLENLSLKSMSEGDNSVFSDGDQGIKTLTGMDSENDSEEVDDIELIFTTEDTTKEVGALQEDLVSITDGEKWRKDSNSDTPVLLNFRTIDFDSENVNGNNPAGNNSDDDVFFCESEDNNIVTENEQSTSRNGNQIAKQDHPRIESNESYINSSFDTNQSFDKDEQLDQFGDRTQKLEKLWSQCSVLVETDISKCGVLDETTTEMPNLANRRNTCPNPLAYRPIIHRDNNARTKYQRRHTSAIRPILNEKYTLKTESEAQTDISALPCPWKSESYLAHHKVSHNFTTLPSKFALPTYYQTPRIRLSEKTQEARRVLLSDINFTSMVPELSRSADHLCQEQNLNVIPQPMGNQLHPQYLQNTGYVTRNAAPYLKAGDVCRKYDLTTSPFDEYKPTTFGKFHSSSDYSNFGSSNRFESVNSMQYMIRNRGSVASITPPASHYDLTGASGSRSSSFWRQGCPASFDTSRGIAYSSRSTFGSVPTSPTKHHRSRSVPHVQRSVDSSFPTAGSRYNFGRTHSRPTSQWSFGQRNKTRSRVTFEDTHLRYSRTNQSLPDLRSDSYDSGGDSTDSLIEEAEHYLRRSIDCMVSGGAAYPGEEWKGERSRTRRASAPDPVRETDPPSGSTPYLPRIPRDLRQGHWVKIIGPDGRVRGGRVRHIGAGIDPLALDSAFIGVELATPTGNSDGSYLDKRYFDCDPDHAIFVPFKKVIMAWST